MANRRNPVFEPYRQAQIDARNRELSLRYESLQRLDKVLRDYAESLGNAIASLPSEQTIALLRAQRIVESTARRLEALLGTAIETGREIAFADILAIQNAATLEVANAIGDVPYALLGAVTVPTVTLAGAWEALGTGAATWKTLLRGYVNDAVADAQAVVSTALFNGMSPQELSKRLRPYVRGAESFQRAFKDSGEIADKILAKSEFTKAASQLRYNADRIAYSEIHNARGEAELQAYAADPFIGAVRWELSPNRGTQKDPDVCDALARTDFYGLGKGVYPIKKVPISPHPFDRCERVPVSRGIAQMHDEKPNPKQVTTQADFPRKGLTAKQADRIEGHVRQVFEATHATGIEEKIDRLQNQSGVTRTMS